MATLIVSLDDKRALDPAVAGGKGASLAWLRRQGFRTPAGFVLSTAAFDQVASGRPLRDGGLPDGWPRDVAMPTATEWALRKAYRRLAGSVAVRSSLLSEDGEFASYAGQLDTVLNVVGEEDVLAAVWKCWGSSAGRAVTRYAAERDALTQSQRGVLPMAVVVQRMVAATSAGVAFSADPSTGQREVLIEAVHGLGDQLVQGYARPDRFRVDSAGVLVEEALEDPAHPTLSATQALLLAGLVRNVARRRGAPQDVEWAWDGKEFHLLQTRPITTLAGLHIYSNRMVSDMAPGLVKPLVYSILTTGIARWVFGRVFTDLIGPNDVDYTQLVTRIRSRVYADMTLMGRLLEQIGLPPNFLEMMGRDEQGAGVRPPMSMRSMPAMMKLARFAWRHARLHHEIRQFLAQYTIVLKDYRSADWRGADTAALIAALDRLIGAHAELSWCNFMAQINMMGRNRIVDRWVKRTAPGANPGDLVRGLLGLRSLEPNTELRRLALLAQSVEPEIRSQLLECSNEHSRRALLSDTTHGAELLEAVERFMATFGHLSANGSDFSETPWVEMPALIWQAILRAAEQEPSSLSPAESSTQAREAARVAVRTQQTLPERWLFDRLLVSTVAYIDLRELVSDATSQGIHQMRRILLALAEALVRRDALRQPGHLFYLNYDEVRALADGSLSSSEAQARCSARMAEIATDATVDLPPIILGDRIPVRPIQLAAGQRFLAGIGGSSGCVRGIARVVMDPANAPPDLGRGDILVVPFTDVGWTPLFPGIGGIVAETGGRLSHTSIVAREYGLPAVVSVHQATHLLTEGQPITLDGDAGRVYLDETLKQQGKNDDTA